ncbi:MAG: hypothetical protein ABSD98_10060 [Candidatus Korobacteraceae bacterium]|jgi:hypothetical protein
MNKIVTALLAMALCIPAISFAQNSGQQDNNQKLQQQEMNQSAQDQVMGGDTAPHHTMSGTVSNNGANFTSGDTTYVVANPDKLKGYDNQSVSIKFHFDADSNQIHVDSVSPGQAQ